MKLSFLIPAYNAEDYLERCVQSILEQSDFFELEIIIINDGSTDQTVEILDSLVERYSCVTAFNQKNKGVYNTRNFGLTKVSGDYIWMLDADDYLAPMALKRLLETIVLEEQIDIFHFGYNQEITDNNFITRLPPGQHKEVVTGVEFLNRNDGRLYLWNNVYRLQFLKEEGLNFLGKSVSLEDSLFNLNAFIKAEKVKFINYVFYNYALNAFSISRTKTLENLLKQGESSINVHQHVQILKNKYPSTSKEYKILNIRLEHSILGFFYSLYVENYPKDYIKKVFKFYRKESFFPLSESSESFKLSIFKKMINWKWPFYWLCKLKKT